VGTKLNKDAYKQLIKEDMEKVEKYFPKHSLEKKHIQEVLKCSIECYYPSDDKKQPDTTSNCNIPHVIVSGCKGRYRITGDCVKYGGECTKGDCDYWQPEL
jgi:hypothetical protein